MKSQGFTLLELLIAMALNALLLLGTARFLPQFQQQQGQLSDDRYAQEALEQLAATLAKHLRRAGYCNGTCSGSAVRASPQCLIVRWDSNSNGKWDVDEQFAFRLQSGAMQAQRGVGDCQQGVWERLTDPRQLRLTHFSVEVLPERLFKLQLVGETPRESPRRVTVMRWVKGENL
ncbi:prepilin-type cleavage/methylation domain-containing protein [Enterobacterales bacterium CwR94]|nr:prepilin-type cleavage/methylation domain-containing protein [Enterobacterales bacterium CwR94]